RKLRNELVEIHIGFARHIAGRYKNRGVNAEDLHQIALLALVKSVDRYDPANGAAFTSFAGRTIEGEIKHYFRDATWAVRVPRSAKELHLAVRRANDELSSTLGRSPSVTEVAEHLDIDRDQVVQALGASAAFSAAPLDVSAPGDDATSQDRSARLATDDADLEAAPERIMVRRLIETLPEREREIVRLRFFDELTQEQIAERVGVSQMHVSRLIRRSLASMRALAGED
ncbi:UNVERIFIED_CONTAM: hypothetical protein GTU68_023289, partial [Idotea baltica]|nr:hypothetical protein [Idotea baltica]